MLKTIKRVSQHQKFKKMKRTSFQSILTLLFVVALVTSCKKESINSQNLADAKYQQTLISKSPTHIGPLNTAALVKSY